ncbi:MAG: class I SAM-dependent methyltransferase [Chloroflexi bacterium]|nr:class I SAM-dependent methyltransferase [Chloroflexota bacterium]
MTRFIGVPGQEERFHDRWARSLDPAGVDVRAAFERPSAPENRFILRELGDLRGIALLELGSGLGEAAVYFALQGARVTATDVSTGMLEVARRVAALHGVTLDARQMAATRLDVPDEGFDVVYCANVLHHVDIPACLREVRRVLRPGGAFAFWEPLKYNPAINRYRAMASQVRSPDEHPLGRSDLALVDQLFGKVKTQFTWLMTLAVFARFYFVDTIHPNEERYWKKVLQDYETIAPIYRPLRRLDEILLRLPGLRWLAWNVAVVARK